MNIKLIKYFFRILIIGIIPFLLGWNVWANRAGIFSANPDAHNKLIFIGCSTIFVIGIALALVVTFLFINFIFWIFED